MCDGSTHFSRYWSPVSFVKWMCVGSLLHNLCFFLTCSGTYVCVVIETCEKGFCGMCSNSLGIVPFGNRLFGQLWRVWKKWFPLQQLFPFNNSRGVAKLLCCQDSLETLWRLLLKFRVSIHILLDAHSGICLVQNSFMHLPKCALIQETLH